MHEFHHRYIIDHRCRIRQCHHRRHAAGGGRFTSGFDRFLVLFARLPELYPHVDKAGREATSFAVDDFRYRGGAILEEFRTEIRDLAVFNKQRAEFIESALGIEEAGV